MRHYRIGLPLTLPQLTRLTTPVLLDRFMSAQRLKIYHYLKTPQSIIYQIQLAPLDYFRLIHRRLFPLALEVAQFLQLPPAEGKSRVLAHWAIYKVP